MTAEALRRELQVDDDVHQRIVDRYLRQPDRNDEKDWGMRTVSAGLGFRLTGEPTPGSDGATTVRLSGFAEYDPETAAPLERPLDLGEEAE